MKTDKPKRQTNSRRLSLLEAEIALLRILVSEEIDRYGKYAPANPSIVDYPELGHLRVIRYKLNAIKLH